MTIRGKLPCTGLVLNIGCGEFDYLSSFEGEIINCDIDKKSIRNFIQCKGEKLPFKGNIFDHIIAMDVLEHIEEDNLFLEEIHRVLKYTGKVFLTTSCREDDFLLIEIPKKIDWAEAEKDWGHVRRGYTTEEFKNLCGNFFYLSYLERYGATFARIGYQLYYLRQWYKFWNYFPPCRWFLRFFNYLDFLFCRGKGHMIFAILSPKDL